MILDLREGLPVGELALVVCEMMLSPWDDVCDCRGRCGTEGCIGRLFAACGYYADGGVNCTYCGKRNWILKETKK